MPEAGTRPAPTDHPPDIGAAIEAAVADIESQFASYLPRPERVVDACGILRREAAGAIAAGHPDWLERLLPLPGKRPGAIVVPLFEWLEEAAQRAHDGWPIFEAMLGVQEAALQRRAVTALRRAVEARRVVVSPAIIETLAELAQREGSGLAADEGLREIGGVVAHAASITELLAQRVSPAVQRLAARVLDLDGTLPPDQVARRVLGQEAAALFAPYLLFTRATHLDLVSLVPAADDAQVLGVAVHEPAVAVVLQAIRR